MLHSVETLGTRCQRPYNVRGKDIFFECARPTSTRDRPACRQLDRNILKHKKEPCAAADGVKHQAAEYGVHTTQGPKHDQESDRQAAASLQRRARSRRLSKSAYSSWRGCCSKTTALARSQVSSACFAREKLGSTAGEGIAIPHGRIKGQKRRGRNGAAPTAHTSMRPTARSPDIFVCSARAGDDLHLQSCPSSHRFQ